MEKVGDLIALTRREVYQAMCSFEQENETVTSEDLLEDITQLIFETVG